MDFDGLVVWNMNCMTFHILGMSSSQLTHNLFQRGRYTTHQMRLDDIHVFTSCWEGTSNFTSALGIIYLFRIPRLQQFLGEIRAFAAAVR